MTYGPSEYDVIEAMERFGGSFVSALAKAWRAADEINKAKLREAFPNYWEQYHAMVSAKWARDREKLEREKWDKEHP